MTCRDEPTLDQLLGDPMTQALMTADRVDPSALAAMLRSVAHEINGCSPAWMAREVAMARDAASVSHICSQHAVA